MKDEQDRKPGDPPKFDPYGWCNLMGAEGVVRRSLGKNPASVELPSRTLSPGQRGAVLSVDYKGYGPDTQIRLDLNPHTTRTALLLFERIDFPKSQWYQAGDTTADYLYAEHILQRTKVDHPVAFDPDGNEKLRVAFMAFEALHAREPGRWSMVRSSDANSLLHEYLERDTALMVSMYNALPIPDRSVPFDDVLQFKAKRTPELLSLRTFIEEICLEVKARPDVPLAAVRAVEKFDRALSDYARSIREKNWKKVLGGLDVSINWADTVAPSLIAVNSAAAGLPLATTAIAAGAGLLASMTISSSFGLKSPLTDRPFEYVARIERELF